MPAAREWVAPQNTHKAHPTAAQDSVLLNCLIRVFGASGIVDTTGREERRDEAFVKADQTENKRFHIGKWLIAYGEWLIAYGESRITFHASRHSLFANRYLPLLHQAIERINHFTPFCFDQRRASDQNKIPSAADAGFFFFAPHGFS